MPCWKDYASSFDPDTELSVAELMSNSHVRAEGLGQPMVTNGNQWQIRFKFPDFEMT